jgi:DNA polymerase-1
MKKSLYLIDGHYQIYRSFYAAPNRLSTSTGEPTGAIHVFCQMLLSLIRERKPDYLAVVMDVSDRTVFRCEIDPEYKANRDAPPEALTAQADHIVNILESLEVPLHRLEGFEADDLMATFAEQLRGEPVDVYLVSRDKDLEQLLTPHVFMFDPTKNLVMDQAWLKTEKGYSPKQAVEVQTLTGDSTDNVPGVPGVGLKTATKLVAKYGTAAKVLAHADELTPKARERMLAFEDQMPLTRQLVTLRRDAPVTLDLDSCAVDKFNPAQVMPLLKELELNRLTDMLSEFGASIPSKGSSDSGQDSGEGTGAAVARPEVKHQYELVDTPTAFKSFLAKLKKQEVFAFDTETTGINPVAANLVGLSFCWKSGEAFYIPVRGMVGKVLEESVVVDALRPIMEDPAVRKIGHNIKYDALMLRQVGIHVQGIWFDTMIAGFLVDPLRNSFSMDSMVKAMLDHEMIPISDLIGKGRNQITIDQVDTAQVGQYAAEDADYTWRLKEVLESQVMDGHLQSLFEDIEMPLVTVLVDIENNGVAIDRTLLSSLGNTMADRMLELQREVHQFAGHEFNLGSTKQLATVLFDEQGLKPVKKTKTGRSTDADTLQTLASTTDHPIPRLILEYREVSKLKSTYVDTLPKMVCARTHRIDGKEDPGRLRRPGEGSCSAGGRLFTDRAQAAGPLLRGSGPDERFRIRAGYSQDRGRPRQWPRTRPGKPRTAQRGQGGEFRNHLWPDGVRAVPFPRNPRAGGQCFYRHVFHALSGHSTFHRRVHRQGANARLRRDHPRPPPPHTGASIPQPGAGQLRRANFGEHRGSRFGRRLDQASHDRHSPGVGDWSLPKPHDYPGSRRTGIRSAEVGRGDGSGDDPALHGRGDGASRSPGGRSELGPQLGRG